MHVLHDEETGPSVFDAGWSLVIRAGCGGACTVVGSLSLLLVQSTLQHRYKLPSRDPAVQLKSVKTDIEINIHGYKSHLLLSLDQSIIGITAIAIYFLLRIKTAEVVDFFFPYASYNSCV